MSAPAKTAEDVEASSFSSQNSRELKRSRIQKFLAEHDLDGILLTLQSNFAWYTNGGRNYVNVASEEGIADLLITPSEEHLFTNASESVRLANEEFPWTVSHVHLSSWWDEMKRKEIIVSLFGKHVETDAGDLRNEFARLRYSLLPDEVERYRRLGNDVADSFWEAAHLVHRGMTEHEMAAELSYRLIQRGISPLVLLAAADDRLSAYRHPLPSMNGLKSLALLSVCGRRHGLIVSASRLFSLGAVPGELRRRHRAVCEVSSWLMHHTVPGVKIADLFERLKGRYRAVGFPDEWQLHHQGGATGYLVRDYRASPSSPEVVCSQQAFAWNPTIAGTKSEDTIIVTENGFEVLTADPRWPAVEVDLDGRIFHSPDILVLS